MQMTKGTSKQYFGLGHQFVKRLCRLVKLLHPQLFNRAFLFLLATLATSVTYEVVGYYVGHLPSKFIVILGDRNLSQFWWQFTWASLMFIGISLLIMGTTGFSWLLYTTWRMKLDRIIHKKYFRNLAYYRLNACDNQGVDNPDQRICQDVERMSRVLALEIMPPLLIGPFIVAFYSYKTWSSTGWLGVVLIYGYFFIEVFVNRWIISPVSSWVAQQEHMEGEFRFRKEEKCRKIGEKFDNYECDAHLKKLISTQIKLIAWRLPVKLWQKIFSYYGSIISYAIQLIPIFLMNEYEGLDKLKLAGKISANGFIYMYLIYSLTGLTNISVFIGDFAGTLHRVIELIENLDDNGQENKAFDISSEMEINTEHSLQQNDATDQKIIYNLDAVSYISPTDDFNRNILENLNLTIKMGQKWLITGKSGTGKTSFLRILAGIWPIKSGILTRNCTYTDVMAIMFLPQKPYFPCGHLTLRQQINYPKKIENDSNSEESSKEDEDLLKNLILMNLQSLKSRCGGFDKPVKWNWQETLTPGELQRLSIVRLFYHKPKLAILDESTANIGFETEQLIYEHLHTFGIDYISSGHRLSLQKFHDNELKLDGKSGYMITVLKNNCE